MNNQHALLRVDRSPAKPDELSLAQRLGISNKSAWRLVSDGDVRSFKINGRRLVDPASVDAYLASVSFGGDQ